MKPVTAILQESTHAMQQFASASFLYRAKAHRLIGTALHEQGNGLNARSMIPLI